jgi:hypothetical protein
MRPSLALAFSLALLLVAGCVGQPAPTVTRTAAAPAKAADPFHPASGSASGELVAPRTALDSVVAQPGFAEPNVATSYDGKTLYVGNPGAVWRSEDGGKSWKATAKVSGGGDGDIATDAAGNLYYLGLGGNDGPVPFMVSHDKGDSWSKPVDLSHKSGVDREWIDVTPDGHVYAVWRGVVNATPGSDPVGLTGSGGDPQISFNSSPDGGATWSGMVKVGADGDGGPVVHDPVSGALAVPVIDMAQPVGTAQPIVHVYTSADQGASWAKHDVATLGRSSPAEPNAYASDFPVAAFDGNGTLYLVYSADSATTPGGATPPEEAALYGIYLQVSHDLGASWSKPKLVSDVTKDARFPWIAAGAPGRLAIAWYENEHGVPGEMLPDAWDVKLAESVDGGGKLATATLTKAPNHVGALCTSGTGCLAADRSMLDYFEVAIGAGGQPLVAYASSTVGTGVGVAVKKTEIHFATVEGTSLV